MKRHLAVLSLCLLFIVVAAFAHNGMEHVMGTVTQTSADSITVSYLDV